MKKSCSKPKKAVFLHFGFSLVEMLMALLVASLLLAALAPVMTKKFGENVNVSGLGTFKAPADMQCYSYSDLNPSVKVNINDVYTASFIMASGGGGGAGATSTRKVSATPIQITGTDTSDKTKTITIDEYMTDVKVTLAGAGGGGAGGAGYVTGCPTGTYQVNGDSSTVKAFCMTKYNAGERANKIQAHNYNYVPSLPLAISVANKTYWAVNDANSSAYCAIGKSKERYCCWYATGNSDYISSARGNTCTSSGGYNACARTVCGSLAANAICKAFTYKTGSDVPTDMNIVWELPTFEQLKHVQNTSAIIQGSNGILLCDQSSNTGGYICAYGGARCNGTGPTGCHPYYVWGYDENSSSYVTLILDGTKSGVSLHSSNLAESVRCTLDKTKLMKSYSGSGGAAGAYISELDLTSYVKQAGVGGTIEITAGKEGKGGDGATANNTKASNGTAGNLSKIIIKNKDGDTVYGIRTKGGNGGTAADSITVNGNSAVNPNISTNNNCEYTLDGTNWINTSCTKNILKGNNGNTAWTVSAAIGNGAISPMTSNTQGNGAGGNGGTSSYGYNDKSVNENGTNGKGGLVKITYNNEYAGAGGGGGGGGSVVQIKDVLIGNKAECTLTIGKGGKGGSVDNNGEDGGLSSVKCDNDPRTFEVPGGTGGKMGTSALNSITNPIPGLKGLFGDVTKITNTSIKNYNESKKLISNGLDGKEGAYNQTTKESIGGRGGTSGTGTKGGCGGLYTEEGICTVNNIDPKRIEGKGFTYDDTLVPSPKDIQSTDKPSFGKAAAGGGGGGWTRNLNSGKGGDGMNGYVCVYWYNE